MYSKFQKFGFVGILGLTALLLVIALVMYNSTTYVRVHDQAPWQDYDAYKGKRQDEIATSIKEEKAANEQLRKINEQRGAVYKELTAAEKQEKEELQKKYEEGKYQKLENDLKVLESDGNTVGETGALLNVAWIFFFVTIGVALLVPIGYAVFKAVGGDWKGLAITGGSVLLLIIIFFISKSVAGSEVSPAQLQANVTPEDVTFSGGLIIMTWILAGIAFVGILYSEISKLFK